MQRRNQRGCIYLTLEGVTKTAEEWAKDIGLNPETIRRRKKKGLSDEMALKAPNMARIPTRNWGLHGMNGSAALNLSDDQVKDILSQYIPGDPKGSIPALARKYGVSRSHVHRLLHGKAGSKRRNSRAGEGQ
jgi:plasmid maintenance system antidote protein VapI